jgi:hypothetical protein
MLATPPLILPLIASSSPLRGKAIAFEQRTLFWSPGMPVGLQPTGISGTFATRGWALIAKTNAVKAPDIFCSEGQKIPGNQRWRSVEFIRDYPVLKGEEAKTGTAEQEMSGICHSPALKAGGAN